MMFDQRDISSLYADPELFPAPSPEADKTTTSGDK